MPLLDGYRRGGAGPDRVDHRPVAAHVRLHHMGGNDIRQNFCRMSFGLGSQQVAVEHGLHVRQAADTGALGAGHQTRVHPPRISSAG